MFTVLLQALVPLLSLFIFVLGTGFFATLLALKMTLNHASPLMIGAMTGVFYAGLVLGSFRAERFISRVGHIRAYAAFSAVCGFIIPLFILRKAQKPGLISEEAFLSMPQTTPIIADLDPRAEA